MVDDAGDPVAGARVELIRSKIVDGHRELAEDSFKQADDTGAYRFSSLPAGSYFLAVSAVPWYTKFNASLGDPAPASMTHAGYAVRYYPNVGDAGVAEPLALAAGQEAAANFALFPVPAASVFVHCEAGEDLAKHYTLLAAGLAAIRWWSGRAAKPEICTIFLGRSGGTLYAARGGIGRKPHVVWRD